jgi:TPR repeat protein
MTVRTLNTTLASMLLTLVLSGSPILFAAEKSPGEPAAPAEVGAAESQYRLALAHLKGDGVPKDPAKAFTLMKQAAGQGHGEAQGGLGYLYSAGIGTEKDDTQAAAWFRKGAEKGAAKAQFNLGRILLNGRGVAKDEKEAFQWIERAADQGLTEALVLQGESCFFGDHGQQQDYKKAFVLLQKAAEAGNASAQNLVGMMFMYAKGVKSDRTAAEAWFRKAAGQGLAKGQANLGICLAGKVIEEGPAKIETLKWLMVGDMRGEVTARKLLEEILVKTSPADEKEARRQAEEILSTAKPAGAP